MCRTPSHRSIRAVPRATEASSTTEDNCRLNWAWERRGGSDDENSRVVSHKSASRLRWTCHHFRATTTTNSLSKSSLALGLIYGTSSPGNLMPAPGRLHGPLQSTQQQQVSTFLKQHVWQHQSEAKFLPSAPGLQRKPPP